MKELYLNNAFIFLLGVSTQIDQVVICTNYFNLLLNKRGRVKKRFAFLKTLSKGLSAKNQFWFVVEEEHFFPYGSNQLVAADIVVRKDFN